LLKELGDFMVIEVKDTTIVIDGKEFNKSYLERIIELPFGFFDTSLGSDEAIHPLLKVLAEYPQMLDVLEDRFQNKQLIEKINKEMEKKVNDYTNSRGTEPPENKRLHRKSTRR